MIGGGVFLETKFQKCICIFSLVFPSRNAIFFFYLGKRHLFFKQRKAGNPNFFWAIGCAGPRCAFLCTNPSKCGIYVKKHWYILCYLRRWDPLGAAYDARHVWHVLHLVRGLLGLLVDVVQQGLPVQRSSRGLCAVVGAPAKTHSTILILCVYLLFSGISRKHGRVQVKITTILGKT